MYQKEYSLQSGQFNAHPIIRSAHSSNSSPPGRRRKSTTKISRFAVPRCANGHPPPPFQTFNTAASFQPDEKFPGFLRGVSPVTTPSKIVSRRERAAAWQLTTRNRERKRETIPAHTRPVPPTPRRASRFSSASSRSGLRVTRPRLVTRSTRAHARTRGRRQAADSFRAATAKRHRNRGENAAGPCAFDVVACTPSSRSTNERVSPRVLSHRQGSTTTTAPIERVISGDPSPPQWFFSPRSRGWERGEGGTRIPRGGLSRGYVEGGEEGKDATDEWRSRVEDAC